MAETSTQHFAPADDKFLVTLYNALPDAVVGVDSGSGRILHWNDAAAAMFGRPAQDVVGKGLDVIYTDPATFQSFFANLLSEIRKRGRWDTKFRVRGSDGADVDVELTAALCQRRESNDEYVVLVFHRRSRAEAELQSLNDRLVEIVRERTKHLQLLQEIAVIANEASSIDDALEVTIDKICKETSFPCPETALLIGHVYRLMTTAATSRVDYWYLSHPEELTPFRAASESVHFDYGVGLIGRVLASRKLEWVADFAGDRTDPRAEAAKDTHLKTAIAFPILAGEDVVAVMEMFTSETVLPEAPLLEALSQIGVALGRIVERKRTEERLRQNELLVTVGLAAAKLAHEISNPLNGMYTSTQLLEQACKNAEGSDDIILSTVKDLKTEIDRLRYFLHEFRTLSSPMKFDFELSDVSELAREVVASLAASHYTEQAITIEVNFPGDMPKVVLDREKIKQALLNLCQNAADAMRRGGTLTIRGYKFWEAVCLEVHDTGPGVPERMNVFEIFTTTKRGGTGLGLPIVQQIVAGHRGSVTFASQSGKGTMFRITLPINAKS